MILCVEIRVWEAAQTSLTEVLVRVLSDIYKEKITQVGKRPYLPITQGSTGRQQEKQFLT